MNEYGMVYVDKVTLIYIYGASSKYILLTPKFPPPMV